MGGEHRSYGSHHYVSSVRLPRATPYGWDLTHVTYQDLSHVLDSWLDLREPEPDHPHPQPTPDHYLRWMNRHTVFDRETSVPERWRRWFQIATEITSARPRVVAAMVFDEAALLGVTPPQGSRLSPPAPRTGGTLWGLGA